LSILSSDRETSTFTPLRALEPSTVRPKAIRPRVPRPITRPRPRPNPRDRWAAWTDADRWTVTDPAETTQVDGQSPICLERIQAPAVSDLDLTAFGLDGEFQPSPEDEADYIRQILATGAYELHVDRDQSEAIEALGYSASRNS
jgi:hypothetical protein